MTRLLGNGPLGFTSGGRQFQVPLTEVVLTDKGEVKFNWPPFGGLPQADRDALGALVKALLDGGVLTADTAAPPATALKIKAAETGLVGNNLTVAFANVVTDPVDVTKSTFDVTVSETDTYPLLSLVAADAAFVGTVLGQGATPGTKPGLVKLTSVAANPNAPAAANYPLDPTAGTTVDLKDASNATSLTLEPRETLSAGGSKILLQVAPGAGPTTFGLIASIALTKNVKLADLLADTDFDAFVKFAPPDGAASLKAVPSAGTVQLTGGTPAAPAQQASASVTAGA